MSVHIDAQHDVHRRILDFALAPYLEVQGIQEYNGVDGCQRAVLPRFYQGPYFVGDGANC